MPDVSPLDTGPQFALILPVGPGLQEASRSADLLDALGAFAGVPFALVLIDDGVTERPLRAELVSPPGCTAVVLRHPRRVATNGAGIRYIRSKGLCPAILAAYDWVARHAPDIQFAMKLDTDSLVIAPFFDRLAAFFSRHPDVGMTGAFDRTPSGSERDFTPHARTIEWLHRQARPSRWLRWRDPEPGLRTLGEHVAAAVANGYQPGEHCLGGGYAVSATLLRRMQAAGYLANPTLWLPVDCPEDVMMGMYTRAVGLRSENFVEPGEVFGVRYEGLPALPAELVARGYAIIHSVKNDPRIGEAEVRAFFRHLRHEGDGI